MTIETRKFKFCKVHWMTSNWPQPNWHEKYPAYILHNTMSPTFLSGSLNISCSQDISDLRTSNSGSHTLKFQCHNIFSIRKIVFLLTESWKKTKNCSRIFGEHPSRCHLQGNDEWRQPTHIPLKMAARCSPKIREQVFVFFQDSLSRKTIFLLWIRSPITYFLVFLVLLDRQEM